MRIIGFNFRWESKPLGQPWHSLAMLFVAGILFYGSYFFHGRAQEQIATYSKAIAIEVAQPEDLAFTLEFTAADGRRYHLRHSVTAFDDLEIGREHVIFYNPDDPFDYFTDSFWGRYKLSIILGGMGFVFALVSLLMWIFRARLFPNDAYFHIADGDTD